MKLYELFYPYKKRLNIEALLKSGLIALAVATVTALTVAVLRAFFPYEIPLFLIFGVLIFVLALTFLPLYYVLYRPTDREVAKRLDGMGLEERAETMLENINKDSEMIILQRADAEKRIKSIDPCSIKIPVPKIPTAVSAAAAICLIVTLLLPRVLGYGGDEEIDGLIKDMQELIDEADISDDKRDELEDILEDLKEDLYDNESDEEDKSDLEDAKDELEESLDDDSGSLGEALSQQPSLGELGEAIEQGDQEGVSDALDSLQQQIENGELSEKELADQLGEALEQDGGEGEIQEALQNMQQNLQNSDKPLGETMEQAENEINGALQHGQNEQQLGEQLGQMLDDAMGQQGQQGSQEGSDGQSGQQEGQQGDGGSTGAGTGHNSGSSGGMSETVFDPDRHNYVNYGDVYASYYADFISNAENGELDPEIIEIMNDYLDSLKNE